MRENEKHSGTGEKTLRYSGEERKKGDTYIAFHHLRRVPSFLFFVDAFAVAALESFFLSTTGLVTAGLVSIGGKTGSIGAVSLAQRAAMSTGKWLKSRFIQQVHLHLPKAFLDLVVEQ